MDPINTEVVSQTRYNLKLLGYVVIVALLAFGAFNYLNKADEVYVPNIVKSPILEKTPIAEKPLTAFKSFHGVEQKKKSILDRLNDPAPLSLEEKKIIMAQFSGKSGSITLTETERIKLNNALNE